MPAGTGFVVDGRKVKGITVLHIHDTSGIVHIESAARRGVHPRSRRSPTSPADRRCPRRARARRARRRVCKADDAPVNCRGLRRRRTGAPPIPPASTTRQYGTTVDRTTRPLGIADCPIRARQDLTVPSPAPASSMLLVSRLQGCSGPHARRASTSSHFLARQRTAPLTYAEVGASFDADAARRLPPRARRHRPRDRRRGVGARVRRDPRVGRAPRRGHHRRPGRRADRGGHDGRGDHVVGPLHVLAGVPDRARRRRTRPVRLRLRHAAVAPRGGRGALRRHA